MLPARSKVVVRTAGGAIAGTVAPYGIRPGEEAGAYTIPLPVAAIDAGAGVGAPGVVRLTIELVEPGGTVRAPTAAEVKSVELDYAPVRQP